MMRTVLALLIFGSSSAAMAASPSTNFGIRTPGQALVVTPIVEEGRPDKSTSQASRSNQAPRSNIGSAAVIGAKWGRVTSTYRSPEHNRQVHGVPNSYHLSGRAIDIARRSGVRHSDIDAAYRAAGYRLIESLDEGDHSHFAFGSAVSTVFAAKGTTEPASGTRWRMVYAPNSH